jgi:NAD+ synthase
MVSYRKLTSSLKKFFNQREFTRAVVGLSGGVDSAVTLALAVNALGKENVYGLIIPETGVSSPKSEELATSLAKQFEVATFTYPLDKSLQALIGLPWGFNPLANQNIRPRLRMMLLYHFAATKQALVLGTSNKSEMLLGYGTKHGDFAADVEVIGNLYKTDVYAIAEKLKIPPKIITRPPTAELHPTQTDEEELGGSYKVIDKILQDIEKHNFILPPAADELTQQIYLRVMQNQHKTENTPVL